MGLLPAIEMNGIATKIDTEVSRPSSAVRVLPVTVIIPARNEARHLARCLEALREVAEIYVVDSRSTDETCAIARSFGAKVVQFNYVGGWPKKRQWAMDSLPMGNNWILLLDADEIVTADLADEIRCAIQKRDAVGYRIRLQMHFLGRLLRHGDANFWKLSLFRRGRARFECRLKDQNSSMADMEVHEHVIADGPVGELSHSLIHDNVESLSRYIEKHNEYSNWEAQVLAHAAPDPDGIEPDLFGTQAQRRRWLKKKLYRIPGSPILLFVYRYFLRLGFLDGIPGLIYSGFQAVQMFHTKAKIYELRHKS
jgi:glycosyltransferase involved in cell wall biosynthesis